MMFNEITEYKLGVQRIYLHDWAEGTNLYKRNGTTLDVEEAARHDGPVLIDGEFQRIEETDGGLFQAYHPHAGRLDLYSPDDEITAILLAELPGTNNPSV